MNKTFTQFIAFSIGITVFVSCYQTNSKYKNDWEKEYQERKETKERMQKEYLDSTVNLSFCGIKIGEPFKQTISAAKGNKSISDVKFNMKDSTATCKAELVLPDIVNPMTIDVKVFSFQDTITSFLIMTDEYSFKEGLKSLYFNKYNQDAAIDNDYAESWGDQSNRSGYYSWKWTFKNQSINLSEFYTETRENYVKDARMSAPENRYGVRYNKYFKSLSIIYSDTYQCDKAQKYEDELAAIERKKKEEIEAAKKAEQNAAKEARSKQIADQDI